MSGRQVAGMMLAMTDKVRKLFLTSLALALAILFFSPAVSRADGVSSSPQTDVFLPPVPAHNQPATCRWSFIDHSNSCCCRSEHDGGACIHSSRRAGRIDRDSGLRDRRG